jgi:hypothetical protein
MNLNNWIREARDHWRRFQPETFKELLRANKLDWALREAAELTYREMQELEAAGFQHQEAWQMVRERYLFPPEEKPEKAPDNPWYKLYQELVEANSQASQMSEAREG